MTRQRSLKRQPSASTDPGATPPQALLSLIIGVWPAQAIAVAARLDIAGLLADGPRPCSELAAATRSHPAALYRLLRALASVGVFAEDESGCFALTPMAELLRSDAPASLRDYALLLGQDWHWQAWANCSTACRPASRAWSG